MSESKLVLIVVAGVKRKRFRTPAMGHVFPDTLECDCGIDWQAHQALRSPCTRARSRRSDPRQRDRRPVGKNRPTIIIEWWRLLAENGMQKKQIARLFGYSSDVITRAILTLPERRKAERRG